MIDVDPSRFAFTLPFVNFSVTWYGILFALGFLVSFFICRSYFTIRLNHFSEGGKKEALDLTDKLVFYIVIENLVGQILYKITQKRMNVTESLKNVKLDPILFFGIS